MSVNNFTYNETKGVIFDYEDCALGHIISADFALKHGLSRVMELRYGIRAELKRLYGKGNWQGVGHCLISNNGHILNLVVKDKYWMKTSYDRMEEALWDCRKVMEQYGIKKLVIPRIGTGMDELEWSKIHDIIFKVFCTTNLDIRVVYIDEYIDGAVIDADMEKHNFGKDRKNIDGNLEKKYY